MSEDDGGSGGGKLRKSLADVCERNAVSPVLKSWYCAEAYTGSDLFIGNCYSDFVAPRRVMDRLLNPFRFSMSLF
ncbi:hypothetical protein L1887_11024 [Cichorium endivia]|nr:hypothetical protein L1887_11024 [Cichorium endivia]